MHFKFLVRIIRQYSKRKVSFCQNDKAMIKFFHKFFSITTMVMVTGMENSYCSFSPYFHSLLEKLDLEVKTITVVVSNLGVRIIRGDESCLIIFCLEM